MHKTRDITTRTVPISHSFLPRLFLRSFGAFSFSQILRLANLCSTFCLRYAECELGIRDAEFSGPPVRRIDATFTLLTRTSAAKTQNGSQSRSDIQAITRE